jgi:hypothetical protein
MAAALNRGAQVPVNLAAVLGVVGDAAAGVHVSGDDDVDAVERVIAVAQEGEPVDEDPEELVEPVLLPLALLHDAADLVRSDAGLEVAAGPKLGAESPVAAEPGERVVVVGAVDAVGHVLKVPTGHVDVGPGADEADVDGIGVTARSVRPRPGEGDADPRVDRGGSAGEREDGFGDPPDRRGEAAQRQVRVDGGAGACGHRQSSSPTGSSSNRSFHSKSPEVACW